MVSCIKCRAVAVVRLAADVHYCKACFNRHVEKKVRKANRELNLIRNGDRVAVAVSGGKDSAALLHLLHGLSSRMRGVELVPVLVDEGIHGYRNVAMEKARALCQSLGLPLNVRSYAELYGRSMDDVIRVRDEKKNALPTFQGRPSCSYCGVFRKQALNRAARELGATKLALGHNADDLAQTLLMNVLRNEPARNERLGFTSEAAAMAVKGRSAEGNGVGRGAKEGSGAGDGVGGGNEGVDVGELGSGAVGEVGLVPRIRPLAGVFERECALYCALNGLPFHLGECPYAGESFRGDVKDFLNALEKKHPGSKTNVLRAFSPEPTKPAERPEPRILSPCGRCGELTSAARCQACSLVSELA